MKKQWNLEMITKDIEKLSEQLNVLPDLKLSSLCPTTTVHIAVDMVNGFVKYGALSSENVFAINEPVAGLAASCEKLGIANVALCDCHPEQCVEFQTFPVHCVRGTGEAELTEELQKAAAFTVFPKLSVNGWLEEEFQDSMLQGGFDTFVITGDCTDMCVLQLALSLKCGMNRIDRPSRVIVPTTLTASCELPLRSSMTAEMAALLVMQTNGIELVENVTE